MVACVYAWSAWQPYDRLTWWLETIPGIAGLVVVGLAWRRFPLTNLCLFLIALHIAILCVGGHYTYARVPLFDTFRATFHWHRNHFDRLGHFAQGFVPAIIAREMFVRLQIVNWEKWIPFLVASVCLAISAFYELVEWWTACLSGSAADDFLGSQGDVWDTQEDMCMALIGAVCALLFLSYFHDRALRKIDPKATAA